MNEVLTWLLDLVQSVDPVLRTALAALAIALETSVLVGLVVPGDTVVIVAATAVASPLEGVVLVVALVAGALVGESIGFWLGRLVGPRIRFSRVGRWIGEPNWTRAEVYLRRRGGIAIFLSRFLPVLHSLVPLTVGMSGFGYRRFLAWTTPACAIWASLYVSAAALAATGYREFADELRYGGILFVAAILLFFLAVFVARKLLQRSQRRDFAEEPDEPDGSDAVEGASDVRDHARDHAPSVED